MTNTDRLFWLLVGVLIGIAIGIALSNQSNPPTDDDTLHVIRKPMATRRSAS